MEKLSFRIKAKILIIVRSKSGAFALLEGRNLNISLNWRSVAVISKKLGRTDVNLSQFGAIVK
jgi:hypothetical protein